ncbi:MAG: hypothetical protein WBP90_06835 [Terracidiphilus sp.]
MFGISGLLLVGLFALGTTPVFSSSPASEKIQATYAKDGNVVSITLTIDNYTTSADLQVLSLAFQTGQDRELAAVLSKTKTAGFCSITGNPSVDVAFIRTVATPTGREITFIASRPLQSDEVNPNPDSQSFDLMVGQFEINDTDNTRSTGFIYPASRLAMDEQGEFHYDLARSPWSLVNIVDSNWAPALAAREAPDAAGPPPRPSLP